MVRHMSLMPIPKSVTAMCTNAQYCQYYMNPLSQPHSKPKYCNATIYILLQNCDIISLIINCVSTQSTYFIIGVRWQ